MRILGLDHGEKRIGVAISDPLGIIATAVTVLKAAKKVSGDVIELKKIIEKYGDVGEIVVGLPKTMKGEIGPQAQKVLDYIEQLRSFIVIPIITWDERLTTVSAERAMLNADVSREQRRANIDKFAAATLLQGYLDNKARKGP